MLTAFTILAKNSGYICSALRLPRVLSVLPSRCRSAGQLQTRVPILLNVLLNFAIDHLRKIYGAPSQICLGWRIVCCFKSRIIRRRNDYAAFHLIASAGSPCPRCSRALRIARHPDWIERPHPCLLELANKCAACKDEGDPE